MKRFILILMIFLLLGSLSATGQQFRVAATDTTSLMAPGYSAAVWSGGGFNKLMWYFTMANINTNVVVALQMKKRNSEWTDIWTCAVTITADGNYGLGYNEVALSDSVRFRFVSESGGTDAMITQCVALCGGN